MKRYLMHPVDADGRYLPPLEVVSARDHGIVVNGLQSLVAGLRHELAMVRSQNAALKAGKPVPLLQGMRRGKAQVLEANGCQYRVQCGCGQVFERGRAALMRAEIWRCRACWLESKR